MHRTATEAKDLLDIIVVWDPADLMFFVSMRPLQGSEAEQKTLDATQRNQPTLENSS